MLVPPVRERKNQVWGEWSKSGKCCPLFVSLGDVTCISILMFQRLLAVGKEAHVAFPEHSPPFLNPGHSSWLPPRVSTALFCASPGSTGLSTVLMGSLSP